MAIIKCPECNKEISDKAESCIHCGFIIKQEKCPECGETISRSNKKCPNCSYPLIEEKEITDNKTIKYDAENDKLICPYCNSDNIQVQIVSHSYTTGGSGCLGAIFKIILALTIIGIPIMILWTILTKRTVSYNEKCYVCQNCGRTFEPTSSKIEKILSLVLILIIIIVLIAIL